MAPRDAAAEALFPRRTQLSWGCGGLIRPRGRERKGKPCRAPTYLDLGGRR